MQSLPLYVGITTLPSRFPSMRPTLDSLRAQTKIPERIFISIPERSRREKCGYTIPDWLGEYAPLVEVVHCAADCGPGTKLMGCLPRITGDACLIILDDDNVYRPFMLERLYAAQCADRNASFSYSTYFVGPFAVGQGADGFTFYTPNLKGIADFAAKALSNRHGFVTDDHWISAFLQNKGFRIETLKHTLEPGLLVYEHAHMTNQLNNITGDLARWNSVFKIFNFLVRKRMVGPDLRRAYVRWRMKRMVRSWRDRLRAAFGRRTVPT